MPAEEPFAFHPFSRMCMSPIETYTNSILASGSKASPKAIVKRAAAIAQAIRDFNKAEREEYVALKKEKDDNIRKINEKIRTNPNLLKIKAAIESTIRRDVEWIANRKVELENQKEKAEGGVPPGWNALWGDYIDNKNKLETRRRDSEKAYENMKKYKAQALCKKYHIEWDEFFWC